MTSRVLWMPYLTAGSLAYIASSTTIRTVLFTVTFL